MMDKEDENHLKREQWINEIHRAAPGVNWRKMDEQLRFQRMKRKSSNLKYRQSIGIEGYWKEVGSKNQAGRIHLAEIDTSNGVLFCASSGGNVWKGNLNGTQWESLNDQFQIQGIIFLRIIKHNGLKRILVASDKFSSMGFYYSDDEGLTWNSANGLSTITNWGYIRRAAMLNDSSYTIYLLANEWDNVAWATKTTLYYSTDHGVNFTLLKEFKKATHGSIGNFDIWTDRYGTSTLFLAQNDTLQQLDSNQNLITISNLPVTNIGNYYLTGNTRNGIKKLYLLNKHSSQSDIYASDSSGINWNYKGTINAGPFRINSFCCSAKNPEVIYFGGVECYKSYDSGINWVKINGWGDYYASPSNKLHADICGLNSFLTQYGDEYVLISTDGGIYTSYDSLQTVNNISLLNLMVSQYYSTYTCRFNTNISHAGSQDQGYQKTITNTSSGPVDFVQVLSGDYGHIVSGDQGISLWMVYPGFAAYYPDIINSNNSHWWNFVGSNYHWIPPLMVDPNYPEIVYVGGGGSLGGAHIFKCSYSAGTVTHTEDPFDFSNGGSAKIAAMDYSPVNPNYWYLTTSEGDFYLSSNGGSSWTKTQGFTGPGSNYLYGSDILPSSQQSGKIYVAGSGYSNPPVYVSNDHGQSFSSMSNGLPNTMVFELAMHPSEEIIFAATEVGPYLYSTNDSLWYELIDSTTPDQVYWSVDYIPSLNTARFATYGRGIWDYIITSFISISENKNNNFNINLYPQPAKDFIYISTGEFYANGMYSIFSINGQLVKKGTLEFNNTLSKLSIKDLKTGSYYILIELNRQKIIKKLIKM
ncbi:T9SS type A sorting domain-containing protein [candidate division KSB1 bacterium]